MALVVVTGMSGAGKSKAINTLEDLGYYCVDNLPPQFLVNFADLYGMSESHESKKIATVVDVRGKESFPDFFEAMNRLREKAYPFKVLFLDADDTVLCNRYKETRRAHPLIDSCGSTEDAIRLERELMTPAKAIADYVIDTSKLMPAELRENITSILEGDEQSGLQIQLISFGYKNGLPKEADLVFDVRFLPNPFYVPSLKEHNGTEKCIEEYVMQSLTSKRFRSKLFSLVEFLLPLYKKEGKSRLVIAFGCTGGKHRSVLFARMLAERLEKNGWHVLVTHRDIKSTRHGD